MKKISILAIFILFVAQSTSFGAKAKGLNVLVNSANPQTQAMAMTLSLMSIKKHKAIVNIVLCSKAGDLADKNIKGVAIKRPNGKSPSAKQHLRKLLKLGANVQVCPLYLPNANKNKSILIKGITVANPAKVAKSLLNKNFQNITF
jgi:hypothetical protein